MSDLIDRQAAILAVEAALYCLSDDTAAACDAIKRLPSAERKGKWIYLDGLNIFECSSCGGQMVRNVFHYCPWCGAKMEPCAKRDAPMTVCPMCTDCREYDHEKHCCPRFNRVIREALAGQKTGRWMLVKGSNGKDYHKCSECLHTQEITGVKNYCAVCGAKMEVEQWED